MHFNLPNILSLLRVLVSPIFLYMIVSTDTFFIQIACFLFLFGAFTDYADGWLARKMNLITTWGVFFDPLADKILTTSAFVAFSMLKIMPWYIVFIIAFRDFSTTYLRIIAEKYKKPIKTSYSAKVKTFMQMLIIAIVLILIFFKTLNFPNFNNLLIDNILFSGYFHLIFILLTVFTVWTLIEYLVQNRVVLSTFFSKK